jgi:selenide, water dikinase
MHTTLPRYDIVLLGLGHTNAHVLRMWRMSPIPDARLTCVSNFPVVTYSGMLPGVLAGQYPAERMQIDLVRLCAAAGARLIVGEVTGLVAEAGGSDPDAASVRVASGGPQLLFADRPPLPFDALSIGIGSVPARNGVESDGTLLEIKPMQTFLQRLEARLAELRQRIGDRPLRVAVVGAGVGGVEIAFCLPARIAMSPFAPRKGVLKATRTLPASGSLAPAGLELTLVAANDVIPNGTSTGTQKRVRKELVSRGVRILTNCRVTGIESGTVRLDNGDSFPVDLVLWATGATAPPLLEALPLPKDDRGFLLTRPTLQTTAALPIFAVGDAGTIQGDATPKAGVYAVRQGPVLWDNLHRLLAGQPLQPYVPQRGFLKLLNTGDGQAIAEYKGLSFHAGWCWKLKDYIDGRFMDKYQNYEPMEWPRAEGRGSRARLRHLVEFFWPSTLDPRPSTLTMRCAGCGGKVGGSVLSRVLKRLDIPASEHVLVGLDRPDDAAIVVPPNGRPMTVTADFFAAPLDDPYLVGRIAALNAASDLFAMGAKPTAAVALATVPVGPEKQQEQLLFELLSGSLWELREMEATLIGGHTIEGPQTTLGFTMLAEQTVDPPRTKDRLKPGDVLVLTKPLGTGILLAAHMRARCRAEWFPSLVESMLSSNSAAATLADEFNIAATTDVTGFGLAGHLLEMLEASNVVCELRLSRVPLLPGAAALIAEGIESTLAPANRAAEASMRFTAAHRDTAEFHALFDPQTGGGLLLAVPADSVEPFLRRLQETTGTPGHTVGLVTETRVGARIVVAD